MIPADPTALYSLASRAVLATPDGLIPPEGFEDAMQEAVTWLLEVPGRAWVRAVDGTLEDPEEQLVADIVSHLERTF